MVLNLPSMSALCCCIISSARFFCDSKRASLSSFICASWSRTRHADSISVFSISSSWTRHSSSRISWCSLLLIFFGRFYKDNTWQIKLHLTLMLPYLANTKWCKTLKKDWTPRTYSVRAILWIPPWHGLNGFQKSSHPRALDKSSIGIGRVNQFTSKDLLNKCLYIIVKLTFSFFKYSGHKDITKLVMNGLKGMNCLKQKQLGLNFIFAT